MTNLLFPLHVAASAALLVSSAQAITTALDTGNNTPSPYVVGTAITEANNGGFGFQAWDINRGYSSGNNTWSSFTAGGTAANRNFNIYNGTADVAQNGGQVIRNFGTALVAGDVFSFTFKLPTRSGTGISGGVGFGDRFTTGNTTTGSGTSDDLVELFVNGSNGNLAVEVDGVVGVLATTIDASSQINASFSLGAGGAWNLNINNGAFTTSGTTTSAVDSIRMFYNGVDAADNATTGNASLDNLQIESIPEPTSAILISLGGLALLVRRRR